jgi:hypothetical protein
MSMCRTGRDLDRFAGELRGDLQLVGIVGQR